MLYPEIVPVHPRVFVARNYARANVIFIESSEALMVVDTTESMRSAHAILQDVRATSNLPITHLVYTHFHGDHTRGARAFCEPGTQVIAHRNLPVEMSKMRLLLPFNQRATDLQFGRGLGERRGLRHEAIVRRRRGATMYLAPLGENGYVEPDTLFDRELETRLGDVRVHIRHAPGETFDQAIIWLPDDGVLLPADLFYRSFPMLSSPMKPDRPVLKWVESLEMMRALGACILVPSHGRPVIGRARIDRVLSHYAEAIRFVHDETIRYTNEGVSLDDIRQRVRLPDHLARLPYLQERYGTVKWAVNGIYRQYTGWFDLNPANLNRGSRRAFNQELLAATGGSERLIVAARQALERDEAQLAIELLDVVLSDGASDAEAAALAAQACERLARTTDNGFERNVYLEAAWTLQTAAHQQP